MVSVDNKQEDVVLDEQQEAKEIIENSEFRQRLLDTFGVDIAEYVEE